MTSTIVLQHENILPSQGKNSYPSSVGHQGPVTVNNNLSSWNNLSADDGYLKAIGVGGGSGHQDLNNPSKQDIVTPVENGTGPRKFPPGVSLLAGKYLLYPARKMHPTQKPEISCVNIQTKEQFTCKILPRTTKGLAILAAYHRLESSSEFVNQILEAIMTPKVLYLIMEKNYGNVHSYLLEKRTLEEAEAANIFKQMVLAVEHCHSNGVIIRDIKMGRFVFMDKEKRNIKLESLEDATLLVDPSNDNLDDNYGCPNYVSPEKAETLRTHLRYPGKSSDVWCLGIVLYTMLSGRYPFNDPNQSKLLHKIRAGNYTIPPGLSSSVSFLIRSLLRKSPAERPPCSEILRSSWLAKHCVSSSFTVKIELESKESRQTCDSTTVPNTCSMECQQITDQVVPNL